jgi:hypothetical protein
VARHLDRVRWTGAGVRTCDRDRVIKPRNGVLASLPRDASAPRGDITGRRETV